MQNFFEESLSTYYPIESYVGQWRVTKTKISYETPFLAVAAVTFVKKDIIKIFDIVIVKNGAGALILTQDNRVVLVKNTRFGARTTNWEIPQETVDGTESAQESAIRSLTEEAGVAKNAILSVKKLPVVVHSAPHRLSEICQIYFIKISTIAETLTQDPEEILEVKFFTLSEVAMLIEEQKITESVTLTALLYLLGNKDLRN